MLKTVNLANENFHSEKSFNIFILQKSIGSKSPSDFDHQGNGSCNNIKRDITLYFEDFREILYTKGRRLRKAEQLIRRTPREIGGN